MTKKGPVGAAIVVAAVLVFLWDHLVAGQTFYLRDVIFDSLPWRRYAAAAIGAGEIPLWNPTSRFGQPFLANPQSAVLYPPHLLFVILPAGWALKLNLLGHLVVGGVSMAALLRRWQLHHAAAALGGITWALGGYMMGNLEFMSVMETLAWCPLTVLLALRLAGAAVTDRPVRAYVLRGAALALVVAVSFLAGQAQPLAYTLLIAAALTAGDVFVRRGEGDAEAPSGRLPAVAATFAVAVALAAGLTAVQWMPTRELLPLSVRAGGVDPGLDIASAHPSHLLHLLVPFASGHPGAATWDGGTLFEFWLGSIYVGLLPLVLVPAAFSLRGTKGAARTVPFVCAGIAALGLLLALGRHTPLYGVLLDTIPGFGLFRWPAKAFQLVVFALCVLAAFGLHAVLAERDSVRERRVETALVAAVLATMAVVGLWLADTPGSLHSVVCVVLTLGAIVLLRTTPIPVHAALAASLALVLADLYVVSRDIQLTGDDAILDAVPAGVPELRDRRAHTAYTYAQFQLYGSRDAAAYRRAIDLLAGDTGMSADIGRTYGGDALQVARSREATDLLASLPDAPWTQLARVMAVGAVLSGPPFEELGTAPDAARWAELPGSVPRAYVVGTWTRAADPVAAMERLLAPGFDPLRQAVVADDVPPASGPPGARIEQTELAREKVAVDVEVERTTLLVVADTWFPGWVARVDGNERDILLVNALFRGVLLHPGDRAVRLTYEPRSYRAGLTWTTFTALALLALVASVALPRRRAAVSAA